MIGGHLTAKSNIRLFWNISGANEWKKIRVVTFELNTFKANSIDDKLHFGENHVEALNLGKTQLRP